ncbi:MAG: hypothetical protein MUF54_10705, partial [Polyangiaceae bacterium]|nr:hypothetical protein [Polyangiaceae bacterium]
MDNFCYQCEQTVAGGCVKTGNCGKDPTTSVLQDLVVHASKGIAMYAHRAQQLGAHDDVIGRHIVEALFATVTNVDFDPARLEELLGELGHTLERARKLYLAACERAARAPEALTGPAAWVPASTRDGLIEQAGLASLKTSIRIKGADVTGLQELVLYGLKGTAAYAHHALALGKESSA